MVAMAEFLTAHTNQFNWAKPYFSKNGLIPILPKLDLLQKQQNKFRQVIQFLRQNAEETTLPSCSFDLVTVMYAFHEGKLLPK
jgi:hypothetical protein